MGLHGVVCCVRAQFFERFFSWQIPTGKKAHKSAEQGARVVLARQTLPTHSRYQHEGRDLFLGLTVGRTHTAKSEPGLPKAPEEFGSTRGPCDETYRWGRVACSLSAVKERQLPFLRRKTFVEEFRNLFQLDSAYRGVCVERRNHSETDV